MLPNTTDAAADGFHDLYSAQAANEDADEQEMLEKVHAAKYAKEHGYRRGWSPERRYAAGALESLKFELAMGLVLLFNFGVVVLESDETAKCVHETKDSSACSSNASFRVINMVLLGVYCLEFFVKCFIFQRDIFKNHWNIFDGSIVLISIVETILQLTGTSLPSMQFLRIFRLMRLARTVELLQLFPELYFMVQGFASAVAAMWWGFVLIALWIIGWSIITVELVNPANQNIDQASPYCEEAFSSVYNAFLLFFQTLMAGDSWGLCILPILKDAPHFGIIFVGAMVSIQLGFTNLVLSVIVDAASKERNNEVKLKARVKKAQEIEAKDALTKMFVAMDGDKTGTITLEEFVQGYEADVEMQKKLAMLHIGREELDSVFALIDEDSSGSIELGEFCKFIAGVQGSDNNVSIMMLKTQVSKVLQTVQAIQAAMENVAVVTGAAPVRNRRRGNKSKFRLSKNTYGIASMTSTRSISLSRRGTKALISRGDSSVGKSSPSVEAGTAQRDDAATKLGGENEEVTANLQASSLSCAAGKHAPTASTARRDEAAANGGAESREAAGASSSAIPDIVLAVGASSWEPMPEAEIGKRTPQTSQRSRGSSSTSLRLSDGVPLARGDILPVADHGGGTPSTTSGSTYREGRAPALAFSTTSRE